MRPLILSLLLFLTACSPTPVRVDVGAQVVDVFASSASEAWLPRVYDCAERSPELLVRRTLDIDSANLILRVGSHEGLDRIPYQIGAVELVVAIHPENPLEELDFAQIQAIFTGRVRNWAEVGGDNAEIQVWGYGAEDELQTAFNEAILNGGSLSSLARQVQSPGAMRVALLGNPAAIGILTVEEGTGLRFPASDLSLSLPVLALADDMQEAAFLNFLACLQAHSD